MKALSLLLAASLLVLGGCKDPAADKAHAMLVQAAAAIKTPIQLDAYTTLVKVWVPARLTQEFVYDVTDAGLPLLESKFAEIEAKARRKGCASFSHVVKYDGREHYVWQNKGAVVRDITITKADCPT